MNSKKITGEVREIEKTCKTIEISKANTKNSIKNAMKMETMKFYYYKLFESKELCLRFLSLPVILTVVLY